jgi:hypothetical protein
VLWARSLINSLLIGEARSRALVAVVPKAEESEELPVASAKWGHQLLPCELGSKRERIRSPLTYPALRSFGERDLGPDDNIVVRWCSLPCKSSSFADLQAPVVANRAAKARRQRKARHSSDAISQS